MTTPEAPQAPHELQMPPGGLPLGTRVRPPRAEETEARYRRPERLKSGDPVPPLELARLDGSGAVRLDGFAGTRPLVLFFGSCT